MTFTAPSLTAITAAQTEKKNKQIKKPGGGRVDMAVEVGGGRGQPPVGQDNGGVH